MKIFKYLIIILSFYSLNLFAEDIKILSDIPGQGTEIKNHFKVHVNYRGTLDDGTEFDSSFKRNQPFIFQIGLRQVILGWEKGLMGMKVGGKRTIKIPPELGYGIKGAGDLIPPNSNLTFEIEIVNAFPPGYKILSSDNFLKMQDEGLIAIDIRTKKERLNTGIIRGSLEMTAFNINGNFNPNFINTFESVATKNDHVVFISNEGEISAILANGFVEQLGSSNMYSLKGGIQNWIKEKRELIK